MSRPDSSHQLPAVPPAPASAPRRPQMSVERKTVLLTSKKTAATINKIARSRGVGKEGRRDVLRSTIARAWKSRLPEDEGEACKVVNKIAFIEACTMMGASPLGIPQEYREEAGEEGEPATPVAAPEPPVEAREALAKLAELGAEKFPTGFPAYVEGRLKEESSTPGDERDRGHRGPARGQLQQREAAALLSAAR
jgi:hypothetical protein